MVNHKFSTLSTGFSTAGSEKNLEKWGFFLRLQKNSTAEGNHCGDCFGLQNIRLIADLGRKDPVVSAGLRTVLPGFHLQKALPVHLPAHMELIALPGFGVVADGEFPGIPVPVEGAGKQVGDPLQVLGVVHMAVPVQIREADPAAGGIGQSLGGQGAGGSKLRAGEQALDRHAAFARQDHGPAFGIHQHPHADGPEQLMAFCVVGHGGPGVADLGGGHGPGFDADGLAGSGKPGNLNFLADDGPDQIFLSQGIIVGAQDLAVLAGDLLAEKQEHGGLQTAEAVHVGVVDEKIMLKNGFHILPRKDFVDKRSAML